MKENRQIKIIIRIRNKKCFYKNAKSVHIQSQRVILIDRENIPLSPQTKASVLTSVKSALELFIITNGESTVSPTETSFGSFGSIASGSTDLRIRTNQAKMIVKENDVTKERIMNRKMK